MVGNALGHLSETRSQEGLDSVCYMWWDNCACEDADEAAIFREIVRELLDSQFAAVQEAALHGLGHHICITKDTLATGLINEFLNEGKAKRPELNKYALQARTGDIL